MSDEKTVAPVTDEQIAQTATLLTGVTGGLSSKTIWAAVVVAVLSVGQNYVLSPDMLAPFLTQGNVALVGGGISAVMVLLRILTTQSLIDKVTKK